MNFFLNIILQNREIWKTYDELWKKFNEDKFYFVFLIEMSCIFFLQILKIIVTSSQIAEILY